MLSYGFHPGDPVNTATPLKLPPENWKQLINHAPWVLFFFDLAYVLVFFLFLDKGLGSI